MKKLGLYLASFALSFNFTSAQQFSHGTVFPTGDILTSTGDPMSSGFVLSYGTFATYTESTLASAISSPAPFDPSDFSAIFADYSELGSATFDGSGNINTGTVAASPGTQIYFWAFDSASIPNSSSLSQLALYGPVVVPTLGTAQYTINSAVANSDVYIGSSDASDNLLLAAVPEPSTYAMMLGALALGFVVYRRRRS